MSNFSIPNTGLLADNGTAKPVSFDTVSELDALTAAATPQYYAGVVPFIAGLELFYTRVPNEHNEMETAVNVHLVGYLAGDGKQRQMLGKGYLSIPHDKAVPGIVWKVGITPHSDTTIKIKTATTTSDAPGEESTTVTTVTTQNHLNLPICIPNNTTEDIYSMGNISLVYTDESATQHDGCIGLLMHSIPAPDQHPDTCMMTIVNTTMEASLIIGARNIIITDPKLQF